MDQNTYTVVALGPSNAGKTVYLGALWQEFKLRHPRLGFHLSVESRFESDQLEKINQQVASPGEWPLPTNGMEMPEWVFTCMVNSPNGSFPALRMRYIDYAGERLTDPQPGSVEQEKLEKTLHEADAFLGLLDGRKILEMMRGNAGFLDTDMAHVLKTMQDCAGPIHFLVTKWDVLEGHYTLKDVHARLLEHRGFAALVSSRSEWRVRNMPVGPGRIRLIPVSSVGRKFAVLGADGMMHKLHGEVPRPLNVDVAFAAVLPDLCARAYQAARTELYPEGRAATRFFRALARAAPGSAEQLSTLLSSTGIMVPGHFVSAFLSATAGAVTGGRTRTPRRWRRARKLQKSRRRRNINAVKDTMSAAHYVIHGLVDLLQEFERTGVNEGSTLS